MRKNSRRFLTTFLALSLSLTGIANTFGGLPAKTAWANAAPASAGVKYIVKKGDCLWLIARRYGTTVEKLKGYNRLSSDLLQIGQVLYIDNRQTVTPAVTPARETENTNPSRAGSDLRSDLVNEAKRYLGAPYVYGGSSPKGFDCSGFVMFMFSKFEIQLPRVACDQAMKGETVTLPEALPGDLVFFKTLGSKQINHVGIYTGNGYFIHASINAGITITPLENYSGKLIAIKRLL